MLKAVFSAFQHVLSWHVSSFLLPLAGQSPQTLQVAIKTERTGPPGERERENLAKVQPARSIISVTDRPCAASGHLVAVSTLRTGPTSPLPQSTLTFITHGFYRKSRTTLSLNPVKKNAPEMSKKPEFLSSRHLPHALHFCWCCNSSLIPWITTNVLFSFKWWYPEIRAP